LQAVPIIVSMYITDLIETYPVIAKHFFLWIVFLGRLSDTVSNPDPDIRDLERETSSLSLHRWYEVCFYTALSNNSCCRESHRKC